MAMLIYESGNGPFGDPFVSAAFVVGDQSLGVKFHISQRMIARSIGGYFRPYQTDPFVADSNTFGAVARLHGSGDFPNSLDLTGVHVFPDAHAAPGGCAYPHGACLTTQRMGGGC